MKTMAKCSVVGLWAATMLCAPPSVWGQERDSLQVFAVIYSRGPAWIESWGAFEQPAVHEHIMPPAVHEHIMHLENLGDRLIAAAPFEVPSGDLTVGISVLRAESQQAAQRWAESDPAVRNGVMTVKVYRWRVSRIAAWSR